MNDLTGNVPDIVQIAIDRFFSHGLALIFAICTLWQVNIRFAYLADKQSNYKTFFYVYKIMSEFR